MEQEEISKELASLYEDLEDQQSTVEETRILLEESAEDTEVQEMLVELLASVSELEEHISKLEALQVLVTGEKYRFRHTDGRWHYAIAKQRSSEGVLMQFACPTQSHMLSTVRVDPRLVKAVPSHGTEQKDFHVGCRVYAKTRTGLWEAAELISNDGDGYTVTFTGSGESVAVGEPDIVHSAYAADSSSEHQDEQDPFEWLSNGLDDSASDEADLGYDNDEILLEDRQRSSSMCTTSQAGPQSQTETFGSWEGHTRGIGSKLMVNMGYVKGASLGNRQEGAMADPIQVRLFKGGAGLGSEAFLLGDVRSGKSKKKRTRGGQKRNKVKAKFIEREARRQAVLEIERETGETGVFALVNQRLGDGSEAARIQQKAEQRQSQTMAQSTAGYFKQPRPSQEPSSRKALAAVQDGVTAKRAKIAHLKAMKQRNQKDAIMAKQITRKLGEAEAELSDLLDSQVSGVASLQSKDREKKWLKF